MSKFKFVGNCHIPEAHLNVEDEVFEFAEFVQETREKYPDVHLWYDSNEGYMIAYIGPRTNSGQPDWDEFQAEYNRYQQG